MIVPKLRVGLPIQPPGAQPAPYWSSLHGLPEIALEQYIRVIDDILDPNLDKRNRTILSVSNGKFLDTSWISPSYVRMFCKLIILLRPRTRTASYLMIDLR